MMRNKFVHCLIHYRDFLLIVYMKVIIFQLKEKNDQ